MTKDEAIAIRAHQLAGGEVTALELREAVETLQRKNRAGRPYKYKLPDLPRPVIERANAMLCFRLGLAIGRASA